MKHIANIFVTALLGVMFATGAWAAEAASETVPEVPEGWIVIREEAWIVFADESAGYFQEAYFDFLEGNAQAAPLSIRKGATILRIEARRAKKDVKRSLKASVKELEQLAKAIEKDSVVTAAKLEETFSRAEYALAQHHYHKALEYEAKKAYSEMAYSVYAAATYLLRASAWSHEGLEPDDARAARESQSVGKKFVQGAAWVPKKVGEAMKGVGRGIQKLGKKIKLSKPNSDWEEFTGE